eukprot:GHVQ01014366.1.p2 GENE.GHVQ01014366.1~~GHVQ01014366.1.p2  ORF type:complete len:124 (-),score=31.62 GHVQ01014366.1:142-513(-)
MYCELPSAENKNSISQSMNNSNTGCNCAPLVHAQTLHQQTQRVSMPRESGCVSVHRYLYHNSTIGASTTTNANTTKGSSRTSTTSRSSSRINSNQEERHTHTHTYYTGRGVSSRTPPAMIHAT